jgi:hypothetical protein
MKMPNKPTISQPLLRLEDFSVPVPCEIQAGWNSHKTGAIIYIRHPRDKPDHVRVGWKLILNLQSLKKHFPKSKILTINIADLVRERH